MHNRNAAAVKIPRKIYQVKIPIENASIPLPAPPLTAHSYPALPTMSYLQQTVTNLTTKRYLFTAFFHASASLNAALALQQRGRETEERKIEREGERGGGTEKE